MRHRNRIRGCTMTRVLWKCCVLLVPLLVLQLTGLVTPQTSKVVGTPDKPPSASSSGPRQTRFAAQSSTDNGIFGFFNALRGIKKLHDDQYNDTLVTLQKVMAVAYDQFSDAPTKKPTAPPATNGTANDTMPAEKYRISRQELGYILGKNYRGLRKLFRLELADASNQSRITIQEYRRDFGRALSPYTIPTKLPDTKT